MGRKLVKPTRENMQEVVDRMFRYLHDPKVEWEDPSFAFVDRYLGNRDAGRTGSALSRVGTDLLNRGMVERLRGQDHATDLSRGFAYFYWGRELDLCARASEAWSHDARDDFAHESLSVQGLAAGCGEGWFADWQATWLNEYFRAGGPQENMLDFSQDHPARRFYGLLQECLVARKWPEAFDDIELKGYAPLLRAAGDPDRFRKALVDYCDHRMSQSEGYEDMDATKHWPGSASRFVVQGPTFGSLWPVELYTIAHLWRVTQNSELSLDAPHPLLQTPLMRAPMPALRPMWEDEYTARAAELWHASFDGRFKLHAPTTAS
jgi:hypothetical protein